VQISEEAGIKDTIMTFLCHRRMKWLSVFIITIYFKFGFILINNNIWSAHTFHAYYLITRTNINLIFELCKLITGKQIGTPQLRKAQIFISPIISLIFTFLSIFQLLKLLYFSTISYSDCWEKINNLSTDGNREKIILSRPFIFVTLDMYG
jgi:hypothetical protein